MLAGCLLLASLFAYSDGEYFQDHLVMKPQRNLKTFIYTRKVSPFPMQYERLQYPVKVPYRRPYSVYMPKPYLVEAPKQYFKVPLTQQYRFDKQLPHSYKPFHQTLSDLPVYFEKKYPSSIDSKIPQELKVPIESPVSVSVDKPVLLPVDFGVEKPIVETPSEEPLDGYVSVPEDPTLQFEVSMKKEPSAFSTFEKELLAEQVKGGSSLMSQGKQKFVSLQSELPSGWSAQNKVVLEPIVVAEDSKKWSNFNVSEWVPRYEISDIKTIAADEYNYDKSQKQKFEISEVTIPIQESRLTEDLTKFQHVQKESFVPAVSKETVTYKKYIPVSAKLINDYASKQQLESPNTKTFQFYNIQSGKIIKPEALTSSVIFKNGVKEQIGDIESSKQWIANKEQTITQNETPQQLVKSQNHFIVKSEPNNKWVQEGYYTSGEPSKSWVNSQDEYRIKQNEPGKTIKSQQQYTNQKEQSQQWENNRERYVVQKEPIQQWVKNQQQYTVEGEPDQTLVKNRGQYTVIKEPSRDWIKSREHYTTQKEPPQQWVKSEEQYNIQTQTKPQNSKLKSEELPHVSVAHSSQNFVMSPQLETYEESPQRTQQNRQEFSQQHTNGFQPLIPKQSQLQYSKQIEIDQQFNHGNIQHPQQYQKQQLTPQQNYRHYQQSQSFSDQRQPDVNQPVPSQLQVYHTQQDPNQHQAHQQKTSQSNAEPFYPEPEPYRQRQEVHQELQPVSHQAQESQPQSVYQPRYTPRPSQYQSTVGQKQDYWQRRPQQEVLPQGKHADGPSSLEEYEDRGKQPHQDAEFFGQKRRQRNPNKSDAGLADHLIRTTRSTTTTTEEPPTTTAVLPSTSSLSRRKHRRKHKRRNHETTTSSLVE